jgi:hypothetical protein
MSGKSFAIARHLTTAARRIAVLTVLIGAVIGLRPVFAGQEWTRVEVADGIEISKGTVPGTGLLAMRGVGTIDAPVWKVASILLDTARAPEWVDSLRESRVVERLGPAAYIEYNHLAMPFPVKDREFVSEVQIDVDSATHRVALVYRPAKAATLPQTHGVRGEILAGRFDARSIEPGLRTELIAEVQVDPKGMLPAWLVNLFQRHWPATTFEGMRKQAAREDIRIPAAFHDLLEATRNF